MNVVKVICETDEEAAVGTPGWARSGQGQQEGSGVYPGSPLGSDLLSGSRCVNPLRPPMKIILTQTELT